MKILLLGLLAAGALGLACATAPASGGASASSPAWDALASRFIEWTFRHRPGRAVNAGRHEFDGQLRDFSAAALKKSAEELRAFQAELGAVDAAALPPIKALEREVL